MGRLGKDFRSLLCDFGSFFPRYHQKFIYSFHVPFFFFISGYFTHYQKSGFWQKLTTTLIVPYFVICIINAAIDVNNTPSFCSTLFNISLGIHGLDSQLFWGDGCREMWFVYTLIIIKCIFQYSLRITIQIFISALFILLVYIQNRLGFNIAWGVSDVLICYPFFVCGQCFKTIMKSEFLNEKIRCWGGKYIFIVVLLFV